MLTVTLGVFDHHRCISTTGHRGAGHDPDRFARANLTIGRPACSDFGDDSQSRGCLGYVGSTDRVAIHRGVFEGWHVFGGDDGPVEPNAA